jgi:hypothetical protein
MWSARARAVPRARTFSRTPACDCHPGLRYLLTTYTLNLTQDGTGGLPESAAVSAHCLPGFVSVSTSKVRSLKATGDMNTLFAARTEARKNFESNRNLRIGSEELEKSLVHAEEVAKFLRENVVQGQAADTEGNYSMSYHTDTGINSANWL